MTQSALLNQTRWGYEDALEEIEKLQYSLYERVKFLNSAWIDNEEFIEVHVDISYYANVYDYAIIPGESLPELYADENHSWRYTETDTPVDFTKPIYESTSIYLKANPGFEEPENLQEDGSVNDPIISSRTIELFKTALLILFILVLLMIILTDIRRRKE